MDSMSQGLRQEVGKSSSSPSTKLAGPQFPGVSQITNLTNLLPRCLLHCHSPPLPDPLVPPPFQLRGPSRAEYHILGMLTSCARYRRAWREEAAGACDPHGRLSPPATSPVLPSSPPRRPWAQDTQHALRAESDMRQCLWQRGECVLSLRRCRLAGSEVMQCSLNVEAAVPGTRACLLGKLSRLLAF